MPLVVSSVASTQLPWDRNPLGEALEAGDEARVQATLDAAGERAGHLAYAGSKNAITVAVRRRVGAWGQAGVRLNTVAPGAVETPLLQAGLADARYGKAIEAFVAPIARRSRPEEIAAMIAFLIGPEAQYVHGAQFVVDGGIGGDGRLIVGPGDDRHIVPGRHLQSPLPAHLRLRAALGLTGVRGHQHLQSS